MAHLLFFFGFKEMIKQKKYIGKLSKKGNIDN